ncbi:hypothetical protein GCM10017691_25120 [Pseudonocardia petroleophila]|uniref:Uncharacterized protein n=1 Tax=Pseudonocardia petroleophila TaxID=37331 RepID=A0A7G7MFJ5_9PSEU|nr:hypothetical protein [Pseudonocardia petroleophila]QNG51556.1 hypothetical protein H6H00_26155 [Pseudonocardia petroleophila]
MTALDWAAVRSRYDGGRAVRPLVGSSTLQVEVAGDALAVTQRLWRSEVTRSELQVALDLLGHREVGAVAFSEELRRYYSGGPQVQPTCSRTPNLCAVVLVDLGLLG